ncbi:hypothetical protein RJT17_36580 [Streptomyces sp. P5-A9]|uniref:hypothetical protein n=1 Tax=Streptomyces sp. P5-A9 TaxID=3071730 RepID=UPI002FC72343
MAECSTGNPFVNFFKDFFGFIKDPVGGILDVISKKVLAAAIDVYASLTAKVPTVTGEKTAQAVNSESQWIVIWLAVGSLLFAAARMAIERRGDAGVTAMKGIFRVILVSAAATTVVAAAGKIADDYSTYLFKAGALALLENVGCNKTSGLNAFLLFILAFLLLISGLIHTVLLYIRLGVMIVLLGTLPLAAAASMTDWGAGWWRKHVGWMIAWLMYKPAAALVMYAGQAMISAQGADKGTVAQRIAGIAVMLLSAIALPALLKVVVPATAALGGASTMSSGMSMAAGGVASGARALGGMAAAAGAAASGGGGKSGPSGAVGGGGGSGTGGKSGSSGADGGSGSEGKSGSSGGGGGSGSGGKSGPSGSGGGSGSNDESGSSGGGGGSAKGSGAKKAAGAAAGAAHGIAAVATVAQKVMQATGSALDDADGNRGHNT